MGYSPLGPNILIKENSSLLINFSINSNIISILLFIYLFWQCWIFIVGQAFLQLWQVEATLQLQCMGFSLQWLLLLQSMGFKQAHRFQQLWPLDPVVVAPEIQSTSSIALAHRLSCFTARGVFPDQGSNPCLLHWLVDSSPLSHQGSPASILKYTIL